MSDTSSTLPTQVSVYPVDFPKQDVCCESPCDPPWQAGPSCLTYFQTVDTSYTLAGGKPTVAGAQRGEIEVQIVYQHKLCLVGKQHGGLAYTLTLLPGEKVTLYHSDRFRRTTTEDARYSVQTTFSQFVSALFQTAQSNDTSLLSQVLNSSSSSDSSSGGGGIQIPFLGGIGGSGSSNSSTSGSSAATISVDAASALFQQVASQASFYTDQQRSITVSSYEDQQTVSITQRTFQNDNPCRPVTYFVRKVVDVYVATTTVSLIQVQVVSGNQVSGWLLPSQLGALPAATVTAIDKILAGLPKVGQSIEAPTTITVPTDGVVYDPELSHCCTCDPEREETIRIQLERQRAEAAKVAMEARLMEQEVRRREMLLAAGTLTPFDPAPAPPGP
jgi:hypothetical protein